MFEKTVTLCSLMMGVATFQAYGENMNFEKYELRSYWWTTYLNSEDHVDKSYVIKYSFLEKTLSKVYYISERDNTEKVLYKFVQDLGGQHATLSKNLGADNYEKVLSLEYKGNTQGARELNYYYEYSVLDKNSNKIASFYFKKRPNNNKTGRDYTGGFELRTIENKNILVQGLQPDKESSNMDLLLKPKLSKEILLLISNFIVPNTEKKSDLDIKDILYDIATLDEM